MSDPSTVAEQPRDRKTVEQLCQRARRAEQQADRWTAIDCYQQAFELAPDDADICFRLAYHLDLVGEEQEAISLYEQACGRGPAAVNALLNLAILYEDTAQYRKAERCLKLVVETNPNHERARLFLKDVTASRSMYVDDSHQRLNDRHAGLFQTPVTDFEMSARARNCLKKMGVRTLGDLLRVSEAELMAYKNFGEATLAEIRGILAQRGLRIGQALQHQQDMARQQVYARLAESSDPEAMQVFEKPVEDLDLSVRARKALELLDIVTIGDLVTRTEAELLGIKNFGSTSLDEIKEKLAEHGLSLRQIDDES